MKKHTYKSAWQIFEESRDIVRAHWKLFGLIYLFPLVGAAVDSYDRLRHVKVHSSSWSLFFNGSLPGNSHQYVGKGVLFVTLMAVLSFVSGLALIVAATRYAQGRKPGLNKVFSELMDKGIRLILVSILSAAITVVGFLLFIVPGVYVLGRLYFAPYILINENKGIWESIDSSWKLTKNRMWATYSILLLTFLFAITTIVPIIGPLVASVLALLFGVGPALRYFELKHESK